MRDAADFCADYNFVHQIISDIIPTNNLTERAAENLLEFCLTLCKTWQRVPFQNRSSICSFHIADHLFMQSEYDDAKM